MSLDDLSDDELGVWFEGISAEAARTYPGTPTEVRYGPHPLQVIDIWGDQSAPVWVVSIHGGYFAAAYDRTVNEPLSRRLAAAGFAVANVEYRRAGSTDDAFDTVTDVRSAVAHTAALKPPGSRLVVTGHSAGGYLALVASSHPDVLASLPLAPVTYLARTSLGGWDEGSIATWIGSQPEEDPQGWARMEPISLGLPTATTVILHGASDKVVPLALTEDFIADPAVARSAQIGLVTLLDVGHFEFLDPTSDVVEDLAVLLEGLASR